MTKLLTRTEVAERLHLSKETVSRLITAGEIVVTRVGMSRGRVLVSEADLQSYLDAGRSSPPLPPQPVKRAPKRKHKPLYDHGF